MSELPKGWIMLSAGNLGTWRGGGTPSKANSEFWTDGTIPWVSPKDMKRTHIAEAIDNITPSAVIESSTQLIPEQSILIVTRSGILQHSLPVASNTVPVAINQDLKALTPHRGIETDFVMRQFQADSQVILKTCAKSGTTVDSLDFDRLKQHDFRMAPHPEQRRIVAKVDGLTARTARARADLSRIPTLIARYKLRLLAMAANGLLTKQWREENAGTDWFTASVADISITTFDGPFGSNLKSVDYVAKGVRVVRLENIGSLRFIRDKETFISKAKFKTLQRHELKPDDVLFSSFIAEEVRVCLLPADLPTIAINKADCFCVRVDPLLCLPRFLAYRLASPSCYEELKEAVHGATRPRISLSHLKQYEIELPSLSEQAEIVRRIESAFGWLDRMAADHAAAARLLPKLDAAILAKAFRGELVPQDPSDEPASALLARIRAGREAVPKKHVPKGVTVVSSNARARDEVLQPRRSSKGLKVTKSRTDPAVKGKPYLTDILRAMDGSARAETLYARSDLALVDFYKQLSEEHDRGWLIDDDAWVKAA